jgi:hypothetical protein
MDGMMMEDAATRMHAVLARNAAAHVRSAAAAMGVMHDVIGSGGIDEDAAARLRFVVNAAMDCLEHALDGLEPQRHGE